MEARRLKNRGEQQRALEILERVYARVLRAPERRRKPGNELWKTLIATTALMADIKAQSGDIVASEALWRQLEQWDSVDRSRWQRIRIFYQIQRGEAEEGLRQIAELAEEDPEDIRNWFLAARGAFETDQFDLAEAWLQRAEPLLAEAEDDDVARFYLLRYSLAMKRGRYQEALEDWYAAVDASEDMSSWIELVLRDFLLAGRHDLALELLADKAFDPPVVDYYQAWIAQRRGDALRARHLWRQVVGADDDGSLAPMRSIALCWLGRPLEAVALVLEEVNRSGAVRPAHAVALALGWGMQGRVDDARADLAIATRHDSAVRLLSALEWYDFDTLIMDMDVKAQLREYFDLEKGRKLMLDPSFV